MKKRRCWRVGWKRKGVWEKWKEEGDGRRNFKIELVCCPFFLLTHSVHRTLSCPLSLLWKPLPTLKFSPRFNSMKLDSRLFKEHEVKAKQVFSTPHAFIFRCKCGSFFQQLHFLERLLSRRWYASVSTDTKRKMYPVILSGLKQTSFYTECRLSFLLCQFSSKWNLKCSNNFPLKVLSAKYPVTKVSCTCRWNCPFVFGSSLKITSLDGAKYIISPACIVIFYLSAVRRRSSLSIFHTSGCASLDSVGGVLNVYRLSCFRVPEESNKTNRNWRED